jgi:hypothetical protein
MQVVELHCPLCSTRLRLRDQRFVGRTIHCPDCTRPLSIVRNVAGVIEAVPSQGGPSHASAGPTHAKEPSPPAQDMTEAAGSVPHLVRYGGWTPSRIAWGLAALLGIAIIGYALSGRPDAPPPETAIAKAPAPAVDGDGGAGVAPPPAAADKTPPVGPQSLAEWVLAYRDRHGHFPIENPLSRPLPPEERLGWIAALAADHEPSGPQPQWDRPIGDPLNSRFVRRRLDVLLTPRGAPAANGLPATHYVGVAGVGADAALLPKDHPRAGIFGENRATTIGDVRDGLANTLLIVGVASRPVPWAVGGGATIRGLTAEPYINGPDGFGTGQPDGMYVALADGSVRFISKDAAPVILRRMAAMADGLPLDPAVTGEPGDSPPPSALAQPAAPQAAPPAMLAIQNAAADPRADAPIEPQLAADFAAPLPPSYDVARALEQPIVRFRQSRAVPLQVLLQQLEELAGVPIALEGIEAAAAESLLASEVSLDVSDTTVGGILTELLQKVDLTFITGREFGVRIVRPGA